MTSRSRPSWPLPWLARATRLGGRASWQRPPESKKVGKLVTLWPGWLAGEAGCLAVNKIKKKKKMKNLNIAFIDEFVTVYPNLLSS